MRRASLVTITAVVVALAATASTTARAHVGSPNVYYEGAAGPHEVRVVVRPPSAIPGIAEATVRVNGENLRVSVSSSAASGGAAPAAPAPEQPAQAVPGAEGMYSAELWLLEPGAHAVRVRVAGAAGQGEVVVPLNAVNRAPIGMAWPTAVALFAISLALIGGAAPLAARVAGTPPTGLAGIAGAAIIAALLLFLLRQGYAVDRAFRSEGLFEPMPVRAESLVDEGGRYLVLSRVPDERGNRAWPRLVTDHGKLMHAFLIREESLDVFAHVHPQPTDRGDFIVAVPGLPPGDYLLYADITREDGLAETLSTRFRLSPESRPASAAPLVVPDADDSYHVGKAVTAGRLATEPRSDLGGGYAMIWQNPEIADDPTVEELRFAVVDTAGRPVRLEPYMGMLGHAAVRRLDGAVFAHLHPVGSISMASQEVLARNTLAAADSGDASDPHAAHRGHGMDHSMHAAMDHSMHGGAGGGGAHAVRRPATLEESTVGFPFEFPMPGPYRVWVQVKVAGEVRTGVFDVEVASTR